MSHAAIPIARLSVPELQAAFLSIRSRVITHAGLIFRGVPCADQRAERVAETVALAWDWFLRLAKRGKDPRGYPSVLATYAARSVKSGRRLCGQLKAKDVLSERAQQKHGFRVESMPISVRRDFGTLHGDVGGQRGLDVFEERLHDNSQTPVPDQVAFRCDFPAWLKTRCRRDRHLIRAMAHEERTLDLARRFQISPARVSQLRRNYAEDWARFCADPGESEAGTAVSA